MPLPISFQRGGSTLIYNLFTTHATSAGRKNTRLRLINLNPYRRVVPHLFLVDGEIDEGTGFLCC